MAQAANGEATGAAASLRKAISFQPSLVDAHISLAKIELAADRRTVALNIAHQLQKNHPSSSVGLVLEGDIMFETGKFDEAAKAYEAAYGKDRSAAAAMKYGAAHARIGYSKQAYERLSQWAESAPNNVALRSLAAEFAYRSGSYRYAIEQYEWLLAREPGNVQLLNNLALAYEQVGDSRALVLAKRAFDIKPNSPALADTYGWILFQSGNHQQGIGLLEKAAKMSPDDSEIRSHLAKALGKMGEHGKSIRLLEQQPRISQSKQAPSLIQGVSK
jgi:predicted Zn-dependent protease